MQKKTLSKLKLSTNVIHFNEKNNVDIRSINTSDELFSEIGSGNIAEGINTDIGSKCFHILSGDISKHTLTLTAKLSDFPEVQQYLNKQICYKISANQNLRSKVIKISSDTSDQTSDLYDNIILSVDTWPTYDNEQSLLFVTHERYTINNGQMTQSATGNILYCHSETAEPFFSENNCKKQFLFCPDARNVGSNFTLNNTGNHVEGSNNICFADSSHAEGYGNKSLGRFSHTEGRQCIAGYAAHAEGRECQAIGDQSHAAGFKAKAIHNGSFVWSAVSNGYSSKGPSTFNIKPEKGIDGFYIGDKSLSAYFDEYITPLKTSITQLKNALDLGFVGTILTLTSDIQYYAYDRHSNVLDGNNISSFPSTLKTQLKSLRVAENVKIVQNFNNCGKLTDVDLANTVELPKHAFVNANSLTNIVISENLSSIGVEAFANNTSLQSIELAHTQLTALNYGIFKNCPMLGNITLPDSIRTINGDVFANCWPLSNYVFDIPAETSSIIPTFTNVKFAGVTNSKNNPNFRIENGNIIATKNNQIVYSAT